MITKEQLAERLNGREYTKEITKNEEKEAAESGLVVVFGSSDDLIEFRGAIHDEQGACAGGDFFFSNAGELFDGDHEECCKYKTKAREEAKHKITAIWASDDYSWIYETKIPHSTFDIMEDGEKYCCGIVFSLQDIIYAAAEFDKRPETIRCGGCKKRKRLDCPFCGVLGVSVEDDFYCAHCQSRESEGEKKDAKMDSIDNNS